MKQRPRTIGIIASSTDAFLEGLAKAYPCWVVDTAANRRIGELYSEPEWDGGCRIFGVTFVAVSRSLDAGDIVGTLLARAGEEIDMATVDHVIVRGVDVNAPDVLQALSAVGFHRFQSVRGDTSGFTAARNTIG